MDMDMDHSRGDTHHSLYIISPDPDPNSCTIIPSLQSVNPSFEVAAVLVVALVGVAAALEGVVVAVEAEDKKMVVFKKFGYFLKTQFI
jgi:hypothetical protein